MRIRPSPLVRQNRDSSMESTFCQSCLVQRWWVCSHGQHCCRWCLVRTCLITGLQALSPASLSLLRTVWALMEGLCVPGVTRAVVAILYLSRRCDVRMYRSCACVVTRGLPLWGWSAVLSPCSAVLGVSQYRHCSLLPWPHLQSSCLLATCLRHVHTDEQGPWAPFFLCFSESVERPL